MTRLRGSWTAAAAVTLFLPVTLLLSACAQTDAAGGFGADPSPSPSGGVVASGDQLVLRVAHTGGFVGNRGQLGKVPEVSVYADGRVITQGPQITIYPGPALPNLQVQMASPATVDALVTKGEDLVGTLGDLGKPGISDGQTTEVTIKGRTISAYALREGQPTDPGLTAAQRSARAKLVAFADQLTSLPTAKGMTAAQPYRATAVAAFATPYVKNTGGLPSAPPVSVWPGPALPGEAVQAGGGQGCVTAAGEQGASVLKAAEAANQLTPWRSGSATWTVAFRPLLPEETGCADLVGKR
jgi:hypothetical protein